MVRLLFSRDLDNGGPDHVRIDGERMVIPSLADVMIHLREASTSGIGLRGWIESRDLGGGVALFILDLGSEHGRVAQMADLPSFFLMTARYMNVDAAAFTIAQDILEPTDSWVPVDQPTADALLRGDPEILETIFGD